jgi:hypothetical protein
MRTDRMERTSASSGMKFRMSIRITAAGSPRLSVERACWRILAGSRALAST